MAERELPIIQSDEEAPAMHDFAKAMEESEERKVNHEADLQRRMKRGNLDGAREATEKYAETLGLGKDVVDKTVVGRNTSAR